MSDFDFGSSLSLVFIMLVRDLLTCISLGQASIPFPTLILIRVNCFVLFILRFEGRWGSASLTLIPVAHYPCLQYSGLRPLTLVSWICGSPFCPLSCLFHCWLIYSGFVQFPPPPFFPSPPSLPEDFAGPFAAGRRCGCLFVRDHA